MTTERIISTLNARCFGSFIGWADPKVQNLNPVFVATFSHPNLAKPVTAYCKIYPLNEGERGLINEIIGYLFAHALGVPQPIHAFIAQIPIHAMYKELSAQLGESHWLLSYTYYPVFCTTRLDGKSAGIYITESSQDVCDDIAAWPDLPKTIALDENIAHTDRHINNLLRIKKHTYAAIDNGRLVCDKSERWTVGMLDADKLYRNRLSEHIWLHQPTKKNIHHTLFCADQHATSTNHIENELLYWIQSFIKEPQEQQAFYDFLQQRTGAVSCLIRQRYQHLI